ncbi:Asp23/Gls24 family envelope stress response protein [uncultured Veillonella sp.]|uniref:Asp23/Gls24 family envelope stress response protein n=1 Tax=uncultured Veillonella sp. TaxID=159268 RepID=UPI00261154DE|nr:Asp23/Gls24 family envelope stress response protein [uncultured Veillonella sp.]
MEVIAFVGSSGTGKSHRALVVAHENKIECIIDDGILIHDNKIVAGFSAKKESSRLKAVRRAIFQDEVQVKSVREQLDKIKPNKLMIIGTSDNMVKKITKALGLQNPDRYIRIEDVATPKEIEKAQHARLKEGKHIIPVPTMELKSHFRGYLIDPIKTMWRRRTLKKQDQDTLGQIGSEGFERSVVRPAFSYYGRLTFDDEVIIKLIRNGLKKVAGVDESSVISFKKGYKGQNGLVVDMAVVIEHGYPVKPLMQQVQKSVRNEIEYITGMSIERMSIKVKNIIETKRKIVKV